MLTSFMKYVFEEAVDVIFWSTLVSLPTICVILTASLTPEHTDLKRTIMRSIDKSQSDTQIKLPDPNPFRYQL